MDASGNTGSTGTSRAPTPASWVDSCGSPQDTAQDAEEDQTPVRDRGPWLDTPLSPDRSQIRILRLRRGSGDEPLLCSLSVADLDSRPNYEVLSYVWGNPKSTEEMTVVDIPFQATRNLADFLRCLRLPDRDRPVWADAICIDQANADEKAHQIGLMTDIYRYAKDAHVWFGPFNSDAWFLDIAGDKKYVLAVELEARGLWPKYERITTGDLKYFLPENGFRPIDAKELRKFEEECEADIFSKTLATLDEMAKGNHLYTYPVFSYHDTAGEQREHRVNRSWLLIMDCLRWLVLRPWWSRVWTLQEAVLPKVDPIVHAPPYSFRLSRLVNGVQSVVHHNNAICCKWYGQAITTSDRHNGDNGFGAALPIFTLRDELAKNSEGKGVSLAYVVSALNQRKATDVRDYWFGMFGFLPAEWQQEINKLPSRHCTTTELFCYFSKLLYLESEDLTRLDTARRGKSSELRDLPSWAIDLTSQRDSTERDCDRWMLYDASLSQVFEPRLAWLELKEASLTVDAIRVASVKAVTERILPRNYDSTDLLHLVREWRETYKTNVGLPEWNAFWRAVFMDANVQVHYMSRRRQSLSDARLQEIRKWYDSWSSSNDRRDLSFDRKSGGIERGCFHYRAVQRNADKTRFFMTSQDLPGMGPFDMAVGDEVYALKGCKALAVLRLTVKKGESGFLVVGLCFVDRWMYGRAAQGRARWEQVRLF